MPRCWGQPARPTVVVGTGQARQRWQRGVKPAPPMRRPSPRAPESEVGGGARQAAVMEAVVMEDGGEEAVAVAAVVRRRWRRRRW